MKKRFIIPYIDQPPAFWEEIRDRFGTSIKEVYLPLVHEEIGSGRPVQPDDQLNGFLESGIFPAAVVINPIILPKPLEELEKSILLKLEYLLQRYNIQSVTLANQALAKRIKTCFPSLSLTASTLIDIHCEQQLVMLEGVFDTIVPSSRLIRDIPLLRKLKKAFSGKIRLIVNESCIPNCIHRTQHFYEMSVKDIVYPCSLCGPLLNQKPWIRLTGNWILPQHLYLLKGLYDEIKLAGRVSLQNPARYHEVLEAYIKLKPVMPHQVGAGPASVNIPLEVETGFYSFTLHCKKNCNSCSICSEYWQSKIQST